jgi:DNA-nicking Smr family endonuclease
MEQVFSHGVGTLSLQALLKASVSRWLVRLLNVLAKLFNRNYD